MRPCGAGTDLELPRGPREATVEHLISMVTSVLDAVERHIVKIPTVCKILNVTCFRIAKRSKDLKGSRVWVKSGTVARNLKTEQELFDFHRLEDPDQQGSRESAKQHAKTPRHR